MKQRGFTILDVTLAAGLFAVLIGAAAASVIVDKRTERALTADFGPEMRAHRAVEGLAAEFRMAGIRGEDRNENGLLDEGEDMNGNGVFDADWNLAEGATDQPSLAFSRRIDMRFDDGGLKSSGVYSRRIRYALENGTIVRVAEATAPDGTVRTIRSEIAHGISELRFPRAGRVVTVAVDVTLPKGLYRYDRRSFSTSIALRD